MNTNTNMDDAIDLWLESREAWLNGQRGGADRLKQTTSVLYTAFVSGTTTHPVMLALAFYAFRSLLSQEHDKGIPQRAKLHRNSVSVAYA